MIKLEPLLRFTNAVAAQSIGKTPNYAWLNETLAVAEARETAAGVEYQMYALLHA